MKVSFAILVIALLLKSLYFVHKSLVNQQKSATADGKEIRAKSNKNLQNLHRSDIIMRKCAWRRRIAETIA